MVDYRNILRLQSQGHSQREIERELYCSRHTISEVLIRAKSAGIAWPLEDDVTNEDIQVILFPGKYAYASPYTVPDYAYIHRELAKNGVTLTLLWEEYCVKVRSEGGVPYSYTQYCEKYRRWARVTKATMRITHKPGDAIQVDWAGDPLYITDSVTGEQWPAYIFVAVLPCSWYTYAEACGDMKQENWLLCHVHAFDYFGGVPRLLIPDNAKTATITNNRYEVVLNRSYQERLENVDPEERLRVRRKESLPIVEEFYTWLEARDPAYKGQKEAITYARNQKAELLRFLDDGRIPISNNAAENAIRPFVIGRKNWLFCKSHDGAVAAADAYSLVETAKANGLDVLKYLNYVFRKIPVAEGNLSDDFIESLMPWNEVVRAQCQRGSSFPSGFQE